MHRAFPGRKAVGHCLFDKLTEDTPSGQPAQRYLTGIEIGIEKTQHQGERNLMFAGRVFAGRVFAGRVFAGRVFAGRVFAGRVFAGRMFAGRMFTGRAAFKEDESNFILVE
jgi:hypothetical protein